jgi:ATP-dependent DNA helicase MPH1
MSDDFDDDSFMVDDSFLAEVDNLTAQASSTSNAPPKSIYQRTTSLPGPRVSAALASAGRAQSLSSLNGFSTARTALANSSRSTSAGPGLSRPPTRPTNAVAGPSKLARPPVSRFSPDEFDEFDLPTESLALLDTIAPAAPLRSNALASSSSSSSLTTVIPSSRLGVGRALGRTSSGSDGLQTHLNFRRENQATKGKRWDRTAFAESGRRVDAAKIKAKGKGGAFPRDDDEDMSEPDDQGEPLAPLPKPLVDISKHGPHPRPGRPTDNPLGKVYGPRKHQLDPATKGTYIYPTNRSKRDYQYEIVRGCFTDNCLVALPTGLGKTFVAGVVMLNCKSLMS